MQIAHIHMYACKSSQNPQVYTLCLPRTCLIDIYDASYSPIHLRDACYSQGYAYTFKIASKMSETKSEVGCSDSDDIVPKTVDTRKHGKLG